MAVVTGGYLLLVVLVIVRVRRRTRAYAGAYGAGGTAMVPAGSDALVKTLLAPRGVVYARGEEWSAPLGRWDGPSPRGRTSAW